LRGAQQCTIRHYNVLVKRPRQPSYFIPHGGGPCFFMEWTQGPPDTWRRMANWLRSLPAALPERPRALLVISGHWEAPAPTVTAGQAPPLIYDYYGFPPHTYELAWPAPGSPQLAAQVRERLRDAGIESRADATRGFDHGVFVPLKVAFPDADLPTVQLSLRVGLDPAQHLDLGRALAPLRDDGVLILASGMSYHNMQGFFRARSLAQSEAFDDWLAQAVAAPPQARAERLRGWTQAPFARECHPREEHLMPLLVAAGAAGEDSGARVFHDQVMGVSVSAARFG
jgi:aromatic ring-opening dioxygenase catalytic subunit (LigB family)